MRRGVKIDPFFYDQPEKSFLDDLTSPVHEGRPDFFTRRGPDADEADVSGMYIASEFPEDKQLLAASYDDFERFLTVCDAAGRRYPLHIEKRDVGCFEAYEIETTAEKTVVRAGDTEGVRRALVWLEDEMLRREGPYLPLGTVLRRPAMTSRITRCFFSPINRPPKYGDELSDDIDYYPEEYLNRLMHDGANGVWIYTRFSDLVKSSYLPDYGAGCEARIDKLNRVIEKCARYGVRVYVFAIEPVALTEEQSALLPQADGGNAYNGRRLFCVNDPDGRAFVEEAGRRLFESCPGLGGFISITYGERPTSCSSAYSAIPAIGYRTEMRCPRCRELTPGQAVANAAAALAAGIHRAKPEAEVISWTYGHRFWPHEDVRDYVRRAPREAVLMQNFEEMGYAEQLGRTRQGVDYWLSYAGPSPLFRETAEQAMQSGKRMYMKTQVCCSHEAATVPYVPVPGILFDKYRSAHELGVTGVMQCWYFGNYPSMMSKAAGELAFEHEFEDKQAFLERLAGVYWGRSRAKEAAQAWQSFEKGYALYPLNIMFSYYGPMHDGPVWELQLKPKNYPLPRSWQTLDPTDGDRIGESLLQGHTLEEALELTGAMSQHWSEGMKTLRKVCGAKWHEQASVAEALDTLFASGRDILEFYALREQLGTGKGNPDGILRKMRGIVLRERERSERLIGLCEADGRLGYHSEGEGYKYFPKKLRHRIASLNRLLETEFSEVQARIDEGRPPLAYYAGEEIDAPAYRLISGPVETAEWEKIGEHSAFRAAYDRESLFVEFRSDRRESVQLAAEFRLMWPAPPVTVHPDGRVEVSAETYLYYSVFGEELEKLRALWQTVSMSDEGTHVRATLSRTACGWTEDTPLKLRVRSEAGEMWSREEEPVITLGKNSASPGEYGWLLPEKKNR